MVIAIFLQHIKNQKHFIHFIIACRSFEISSARKKAEKQKKFYDTPEESIKRSFYLMFKLRCELNKQGSPNDVALITNITSSTKHDSSTPLCNGKFTSNKNKLTRKRTTSKRCFYRPKWFLSAKIIFTFNGKNITGTEKYKNISSFFIMRLNLVCFIGKRIQNQIIQIIFTSQRTFLLTSSISDTIFFFNRK